ncbi:MAG: HEAT repeat domain-containing protein, partial [Verrucomicrobiota bacterium]
SIFHILKHRYVCVSVWQDSGWFRFDPRSHKLISFGTYRSTNPWGVTFDDWGQHVASHPIFASAFHSLDPEYPNQHPRPGGLQAYSGVCGQEFIDFDTFPKELKGHFVKVRYKPTNRVELHQWNEYAYGYEEKYVGDIIFSSNLSFIPVDLRYGPRGAMYVCDWYNPVKGHAQYSLRDKRRDRVSGRIWRITAKGIPLQDPPRIAGASIPDLLEIMKRPEYRYRYWAKRELRDRDHADVRKELDRWVADLDPEDPRYRHHQVEAIWNYANVDGVKGDLLREVMTSDIHHARAAATRQLRTWHTALPDAVDLLRQAANDPNGLVRMEAAIAASYIGNKGALNALLDVFRYPKDKHLSYAIRCALGSHTLKPIWENNPEYNIDALMKKEAKDLAFAEPGKSAREAAFDIQTDVATVKISCVLEKLQFTVKRFTVKPGQPVKLVFINPDATDHNLIITKPGALEEVGMAANEMARDPKNARSDFVPKSKKHLILEASKMIGPTRKALVDVLRFNAPTEPGVYPYVCTFPGHWVIMRGQMIVKAE